MSENAGSQNNQGEAGTYPHEWVETSTLPDGKEVTIRPIRPEDAPGLQAGFARLSPQTVYMRFLESFKQLSDKQAYAFANLDYQTRMAFVAETREGDKTILIGVARYSIIEREEPGLAESAIVVADEYQGRGLGTRLMRQLILYARAHGVQAFLATVHLSNNRIMRFIQRSQFPYTKKMLEPGVWEVSIHINQRKDQGEPSDKQSGEPA